MEELNTTFLEYEIDRLLMSTERQGMDQLLIHMHEIGFFDSPCSTQYHLNVPGGLAQHSLNVYSYMDMIAKRLDADTVFDPDSIIISAILHDLGKAGAHGKRYYVSNLIKDGRPTKANPEQRYKVSETKPYATNAELLPVAHEIRSVIHASRFITLTEQEEFAILNHNGMYGDLKYTLKGKETPLQMLLHFADMWASRVGEVNA